MIASDTPEKLDSFSHSSKIIDEGELRDLQSTLSLNFDSRHSKLSLINRSRRFFGDILKTPTKKLKKLSVSHTKDFVLESFSFTTNEGTDIVIDVKTHKSFLFSYSIGYGVTLPFLNQSLEKITSMVDVKTKILIRSYFWDLITMSSDCIYDCSSLNDEFVFRFLDKPTKTTVEFTIFK